MKFYKMSIFIPKRIQKDIKKIAEFADIGIDVDEWIGRTFLFSLLISFILGIALSVINYFFILFLPLIFILIFFIFYLDLYLKAENRRKNVESLLPEFLYMVAGNIRAGVTPLIALRMAARPEFCALEKEIIYATNKSLGTESFTEALMEISTRIKSDVFKKTIELLVVSLRAGGNLPLLLESAAEDIRNNIELRRELITSTRMYTVFILFSVIIGMPTLSAVSVQFIEMITRMESKIGGAYTPIGFTFGAPLSVDFILTTSIILLIITSLLASALIGVIYDGKKLNGLSYYPIILFSSLFVFYVMKAYILRSILGGGI